MKLSKEQLKGRLKNVANKNTADARVLLRQFMMGVFLKDCQNRNIGIILL